MDPRRLLTTAAAALMLSGCALFRGDPAPSPVLERVAPAPDPDAGSGAWIETGVDVEIADASVGLEHQSVRDDRASLQGVAGEALAATIDDSAASPALTGRRAIAAANAEASAPSRSDRFQGGVQIFTWAPGRVFEVWTAPLRVTTLTLGAGEVLISKAAGDTVRWQIGETTSGEADSPTVHVLIKPLERGLETNLVLTTNQRVYLIHLRSGAADAFNTAVAWESQAPVSAGPHPADAARDIRVPDPVVMPEGPIDARYRLEPQGRRPRWMPTAVFNDGRRTFITFPPGLQVDEAPALFAIAPDGQAQLVNYRQAGGLFIVDRVLDRAELRLGDRRPQIVRIQHRPGDRP